MEERKTKKVWVEIYEDKENDFFLSLNFIKHEAVKNPKQVFKILQDALHVDGLKYWELMDRFGEIDTIHSQQFIRDFWQYFTAGGEDNRLSNYLEIIPDNYEDFEDTELCGRLKLFFSAYKVAKLFKDAEESGDASLGQTMHFAFQSFSNSARKYPKLLDSLDEKMSQEDLDNMDAYTGMIEVFKNDYMITTKNTRQEVENADGILFEFYYEVLEDLFPEASKYAKCVMSGFVMAQLGLILTEDAYMDKKKNKLPYRRYLANYVMNRLEHSKYHLS